ncbi:unnamed protein product, partial [Urochloa humidicola]
PRQSDYSPLRFLLKVIWPTSNRQILTSNSIKCVWLRRQAGGVWPLGQQAGEDHIDRLARGNAAEWRTGNGSGPHQHSEIAIAAGTNGSAFFEPIRPRRHGPIRRSGNGMGDKLLF